MRPDNKRKTDVASSIAERKLIAKKVCALREIVRDGYTDDDLEIVLQTLDFDLEAASAAFIEDNGGQAESVLNQWRRQPAKRYQNGKHLTELSGENGSLNGSMAVEEEQPQPQPQRRRNRNRPGRTQQPLINGVSSHDATSTTGPVAADETNDEASHVHLSNQSSHHDSQNNNNHLPDATAIAILESPPSPSIPKAKKPMEVVSQGEPATPPFPTAAGKPQPQQSNSRGRGRAPIQGPSKPQSASKGSRKPAASKEPTVVKSRGTAQIEECAVAPDKRPHAGLDKSSKELGRQIAALQRLQPLFVAEIDRSNKQIKQLFESLVTMLNEREVDLFVQLDRVKEDGLQAFRKRQSRALDLRRQLERAPSMREPQLQQLRNDIKLFVAGGHVDDDLGSNRRLRIIAEQQRALEELLSSFATIIPVKSYPSSSEVGGERSSSQAQASAVVPAAASVTEVGSEVDAMSMAEMAQLSQKLNESLKIQGLAASPRRKKRGNDRGQGQQQGIVDNQAITNSQHHRQQQSNNNRRQEPTPVSGGSAVGPAAAAGGGGGGGKKRRARRNNNASRVDANHNQKSAAGVLPATAVVGQPEQQL